MPDVAVIPIEEGERDGKHFVKAAILKGVQRTRVPKDIPRGMYRGNDLAEPVIKPALYMEFLFASPTHAICVSKKARMVAGLGVKVKPKFNMREARSKVSKWDNADPAGRKDQKLDRDEYDDAKKSLAQYKIEHKRLDVWLDNLSDTTTMREVIERAWADFEAMGNLNLEILEDEEGEPARANHIPSHMVRVSKDGERFAIFKSPSSTTPIWFKRWGDPRHLNAQTGQWQQWEGEVGQKGFKPGADWGPDEATAILRYISYSPRDPFYGVPTWYSALADMLGGIESRDFMLRFFSEKAVPMYAVMMEGGAWTDEVLNNIQQFFKRELPQNYHSTLALEVPEGGKISFEQLSPEPRWWPFVLKYRDAVRDIIVSVHGLSPSIVGVIETAHLGGGTGVQQMDTVKTTEIKPRQETLEWLINVHLLQRGLGLSYSMIKFNEIDTEDETALNSMVSQLYATPPRPAMTTNEAREKLHLEPIDAEWADKILILDPQYGLLPLDDLSEAVRQRQKAMSVANSAAGIMPTPPGMPGAGGPMGMPPMPPPGGGAGAGAPPPLDLAALLGEPASKDLIEQVKKGLYVRANGHH